MNPSKKLLKKALEKGSRRNQLIVEVGSEDHEPWVEERGGEYNSGRGERLFKQVKVKKK